MRSASSDKQLIEGFWKEYVEGFIFRDLEKCARPAEANFLVALGELCYADFFGKLMRGKRGPEKNFKAFVGRYMPQYRAILDILYDEVRCGLVHSYFPDNVDVVACVRVDIAQAITRNGSRWQIAVVDFIHELRQASGD